MRRLAQSISNGASYVQAFTLEDEYTTADRSSWDPVSVRSFPVRGLSRFGFAPALAEALAASDAKLVMSHGLWMYPSIATSQWHSKTGRPYIVHPHGMLDPWAVRNSGIKKRIAAKLYEDRHLRNAACIRALCQSEAESIRLSGLKNPIAVIPNGIDLPEEDHGLRTTDHGPLIGLTAAGRKVLLYLGRIHPKKGLVNLLRAWAQVCSPSPVVRGPASEWVLVIAGWDQNGHEAELKRLATELGLQWADVRSSKLSALKSQPSTLNAQLVFIGPQFGPDKAVCYRSCAAFILPSFSEGLPMVVLEAWAYAKPVIMTPECNLSEGFTAGAAIRINPHAPGMETANRGKIIAEGLRQLMSLQERERLAMGQRGRALAGEVFAWPKIASQMKEVYEWVLGEGPPPSCVSLRG